MRNETIYTCVTVGLFKTLALCMVSLVLLGRNVNAQEPMPEGMIGWWFYGAGSNNYVRDAVTACQTTAENHMGTSLKEMRPHPTIVWYDCKYPHFLNAGGEGWYGSTFLECASGYVPRWPGVCTKIVEKALPICCAESPRQSAPGYTVGNPIVVSTGAKVQVEIDPIGTQQNTLQIARTYRVLGEPGGSLGVGWSFSFDRKLVPTSHSVGQAPAQVSGMGDQGSYFFFERGDVVGTYRPTLTSFGTLMPANALYDEWIYKNTSGRIDHFKQINGTYKMVSSHTPEGVGQYLAYDANNRLQTVTDSFGRVLQVVWKNDYVIDSIVGQELTIQYQYDLATIPSGTSVVGTERLVKVLVKDLGGTLLTSKQYHYEDTRNRYLLTGITDENGNRYATYTYDDGGKALLSEHAGGANRYAFSYETETSRTVTDSLGTARTYTLRKINNFGRVTAVNQPAGAGYSAASNSFSYDGQGNLISTSDLNGNKTCYAFDSTRNLETGRIEGVDASATCPSIATISLPDSQRKILTQWHPDARVPVKITGPKKHTSYTYNGQPDTDGQVLTCAPPTTLPDAKPIAVICKRIEQTTNDNSGATGFNAALTGQPRIWTFTYNALGQILTLNGPVGASGNAERTAFTYYADSTSTHTTGDLWTVTNAKGHLTEFLEYNKSGKATRMRDPNGIITVFTYDPQLRLTSRTLGADTAAAQTTNYEYDSVGLLVKVIAPDGAYITHTYDSAHRLTDVGDGLGNTIHYTLDSLGNRVREEVKDSNGNLNRQIVRTYDALNRLQEVTGAMQ